MSALAPCPFCGCRDVKVHFYSNEDYPTPRPSLYSSSRNRECFAVECMGPYCETFGPLADTIPEAERLWNKRVGQKREPSPQLDLIGGES